MKKWGIILTFTFILASALVVSAKENATNEAETVREKVKEKIENAKKNPRAYIGTVTDKTNETLQVKNRSGEIQLVSVDEENVSFVKAGKTTSNIKFNDVAIGDFVVAMGLENEAVLEASRVLVTSTIEPPKRKIVSATVISVSKKELVLKDNEGNSLKLSFPKKWKGPDVKDISENSQVIVVILEEKGLEVLRTIQTIAPN